MLVQLTPNQARVIAVLLEKEQTTPDQYPLTLNSLTLGVNQKSNREPVLCLTESEVQDILDELDHKKLIFKHQGHGSRVLKFKHRFCNTEFSDLKFNPQQLALICVLMLRGAQTPGELKTRCARLADFNNVEEVEQALLILGDLNHQQLVVKLPRQPNRRDAQYMHLLSGTAQMTDNPQTEPILSLAQSPDSVATDQDSLQRIAQLEQQIVMLAGQLTLLTQRIDGLSN
jgi:uncharacterized protein YceH (UPF0502 family)